ncbi:hypothetical protein TNCV_1127301 [Trichonephila clavipes]|nr:hypothetical protein TNCV_1127301 [Trichonephila clavipes]
MYCNVFAWCGPHPSIQAKLYGSKQVDNRPFRLALGSLFIVWPRSRGDTLTGSHNGHRSAHRVTSDKASLTESTVSLKDVERMALGNKDGAMHKMSRCWTRNLALLHSRRAREGDCV